MNHEFSASNLKHFAFRGNEDESLVYWCDNPSFDEVMKNLPLIFSGQVGDLLRISWEDGTQVDINNQGENRFVVSIRWLGRYFYLSDYRKEWGTEELVELDGCTPKSIDSSALIDMSIVQQIVEFLFGDRFDFTFRLLSNLES